MNKSRIFLICKHEAFLNPDIMPSDCMTILENNYGNKLESIKPCNLVNMIMEMMQNSTESSAYKEEIEELIQDWCNNF